MMNQEKGFTLIEVMVAVVVFAIGITGAAQLFQNSVTNDYKLSKFDEANRLLTSFCEETNLKSLKELPIMIPDNPSNVAELREHITNNFENDPLVSMETQNGIRLYNLVCEEAWDSSNRLVFKKVLLCAAWQTGGTQTPHMLFRTVIKPLPSES